MNRPLPGIFVAGDRGSAGKTTVSTGLAAILTDMGYRVQTFKKGPDFIDPMWLSRASGRPCRNLDYFMLEDSIESTFENASEGSDFVLVESARGLHDGQELDGSDSGAALAKQLGLPVLLVMDAHKMSRSIAAVIHGFRAFDPDLSFLGIVLNHVGGGKHGERLHEIVESLTDLPVLGVIRRSEEVRISERHLGLIPLEEEQQGNDIIRFIVEKVKQSVDVEKILRLLNANDPSPIVVEAERDKKVGKTDIKKMSTDRNEGRRDENLRLAVAKDRAFNFYYEENLEALEERGVRIVPFSPLEDKRIPDNVDGVYMGGGFPEMFAEELSMNISMRESLAAGIRNGLVVYAECGGLMYLCESISLLDGETLSQVGILPYRVEMNRAPVGRGYMELEIGPFEPSGESVWELPEGVRVKAHEFHHSKLHDLQRVEESAGLKFAYLVNRGYGCGQNRDGILYKNVFASYAHLHALGAKWWADAFTDAMMKAKIGIGSN